MKTTVKVSYSVQFINTVTITVSKDGHTAMVAEKCSSANIKRTIIKNKAAAILRLELIEEALA